MCMGVPLRPLQSACRADIQQSANSTDTAIVCTHHMGHQLIIATTTPTGTRGNGHQSRVRQSIIHTARLGRKSFLLSLHFIRLPTLHHTPTRMWPGSLSWVASMNMACATLGLSTVLEGGGRKLATGFPPYLYTSRPSSRATGADIASNGMGKSLPIKH